MNSPSQAALRQQLATEFSSLVRDELTVEEWAEVVRRNRSPERCATHEFFEPVELMVQAFTTVMGRAPDPEGGTDTDLWRSAWSLAQQTEFPRRLQLIENAQGKSVYVYLIRHNPIENPRMSEDGRSEVDPLKHYGLTPAEVSALDYANALLRGQSARAVTITTGDSRGASSTSPDTPTALPPVTTLVSHCTPTTLPEIRRRYPRLEEWHTGGGCMALGLECEGGSYLLITEPEGASLPDDSATEVAVGWYAANGDSIVELLSLYVQQLPGLIDAVLRVSAHPQNVGLYFIQKLGELHGENTLYELSLTSPCGEDCKKAIDAAVALISHVRASLGRHGEMIPDSREIRRTPEAAIVEIARQVIGVYWQG
jgi:hypothetical protein